MGGRGHGPRGRRSGERRPRPAGGRCGRVQRRPPGRLSHAARWGRRAPPGSARYLFAELRAVGGRRQGPPPSGGGPPQPALRRGLGWRLPALIRDGTTMPDPSMLVTLPSLDDPTLAPSGCSSLYVLEPVPNLDGRADWSRAGTGADRHGAGRRTRLPGRGRGRALLRPARLGGDGHGAGHTVRAGLAVPLHCGPFRPANVDRRVPGLVFTGSGTVPGVGVPMVLLSGRLAAERADHMPASQGR